MSHRHRRSGAVALAAVLAAALGAVALVPGAAASAARTMSRDSAVGTWARLAPATSPPALVSPDMGFDEKTGQMVLFGGVGPSGVTIDISGAWGGAPDSLANCRPSSASRPRRGLDRYRRPPNAPAHRKSGKNHDCIFGIEAPSPGPRSKWPDDCHYPGGRSTLPTR